MVHAYWNGLLNVCIECGNVHTNLPVTDNIVICVYKMCILLCSNYMLNLHSQKIEQSTLLKE